MFSENRNWTSYSNIDQRWVGQCVPSIQEGPAPLLWTNPILSPFDWPAATSALPLQLAQWHPPRPRLIPYCLWLDLDDFHCHIRDRARRRLVSVVQSYKPNLDAVQGRVPHIAPLPI